MVRVRLLQFSLHRYALAEIKVVQMQDLLRGVILRYSNHVDARVLELNFFFLLLLLLATTNSLIVIVCNEINPH